VAAAGRNLAAAEGASTGLVTLATFTDPGGPEALADYGASINWGDGTAPSTGTISGPGVGGVFTVTGSHTYLQVASLPITVTLTHENAPSTAVTSTAVVGASVLVLDPSLSGALSISGASVINVAGVVYVDSSSGTALSASGSAHVTASSIRVVGGFQATGTATLSPTPTTGVASLADPFASLPIPILTTPDQGTINVTNSNSVTLNPGIYDKISVQGNATVTLNPGTYVLKGGGLTVSNGASLLGSGAGVLIYNAGSNYPNGGGNFGGISLSGSGTISLKAATSGTYAGMTIFQARDNNRALSLTASSNLSVTGAVYAPDALVTLSGDVTLKGGIIADRLSMSNSSSSSLAADGSTTTDNSAGELLAGDLSVYVDDMSGAFTPDELARIQETVNRLNALLVPYSVTVTEVSDPVAANVVIEISSTSPVGGLEQGVLGSFTPGTGELTLISGWNWYCGADPSQIGSSQFDFETIITHELGHALGLGHSPTTNSPMYASLPAGVTRRTLTTTDLNVGDIEGLPDALLAAPPLVAPVPPEAGSGASAGVVPVAPIAVGTQVLTRTPKVLPGLTEGLLVLGETYGPSPWHGPETPQPPAVPPSGAQSFLPLPDQHGITSSAAAPINRLFEASALLPITQEPWRHLVDASFVRVSAPHLGGLRRASVPAEPFVRLFETAETASKLPLGLGDPGWPARDGSAESDVTGDGIFGLNSALRLTAVLLAGAGWSAAGQRDGDEGRREEPKSGGPDVKR
jgi:hypothetical protein